jgi:hypothetical protein
MANKSNALRVMVKLILTISILLGFTYAQDTIYIQQSGAMVQIDLRQNQYNIIKEDVSANKFTNTSLPVEVLINNNATTVLRLTKIAYIFKISGLVVTDIDSIISAINGLNPGAIKKPGLLKTIKIVSALPTPLEPRTEYIVGDTNLINITGLNGNDARLWQLVINGVGSSSSTAVHRLEMSVNGITTSSAYSSTNSNVTQAGGFSAQALTSSFIIGNISVINTGAIVHFGSNITLSPMVVNANTFRTMSAVGSYARTSTIYGQTQSGGTFRDATTNMTSIQITTESPSTTVFKPGTVIELLQLDK